MTFGFCFIMDIDKMAEKIKGLNPFNAEYMAEPEFEILTRLFFVDLMENGAYDGDDINKLVKKLGYCEETSKEILDIATIIGHLRDLFVEDHHSKSYARIMKRILGENWQDPTTTI